MISTLKQNETKQNVSVSAAETGRNKTDCFGLFRSFRGPGYRNQVRATETKTETGISQ